MTALAAGERAAFTRVFSTLWPLLRHFCERALHDTDVASDAAQTALMKLLLHAAAFRPESDVVAWAIGFASFECLSVRTRRTRRREVVDDVALAALPTSLPSPEEAAIRADLRAAALELFGTLRPQDLEALELAFTEARPAASDAAARKRRQRAFERLRAAWRKAYGQID
jgi:RNA polymerase sigma factor (sigma-70 family)